MDMLTGKFRLRLHHRIMRQPLLVLQTGWIDTGIASYPPPDPVSYWDRYTHWHDSNIEDLRNAIDLDFARMETINGYVSVDYRGRPIKSE